MTDTAFLTLIAGSFVATNVDTLAITTGLFSAAHADDVQKIAVGQALGFAAILGASLGLAATLAHIPTRWFALFGLVPLTLGMRGLWQLRDAPTTDASPPPRLTMAAVAAVIASSGGDNVAVYVPLYRAIGSSAAIATFLFIVLDLVLCGVAWQIGRHRVVQSHLTRVRRWLVPTIYCIVGLAIVVESLI
jgi:cadmium resistance protein CadD (predicted permease)